MILVHGVHSRENLLDGDPSQLTPFDHDGNLGVGFVSDRVTITGGLAVALRQSVDLDDAFRGVNNPVLWDSRSGISDPFRASILGLGGVGHLDDEGDVVFGGIVDAVTIVRPTNDGDIGLRPPGLP